MARFALSGLQSFENLNHSTYHFITNVSISVTSQLQANPLNHELRLGGFDVTYGYPVLNPATRIVTLLSNLIGSACCHVIKFSVLIG